MNGEWIGTDVVAWLLTYAIHSTLLLAVAWWWTTKTRSLRVREALWKTAFVGGLVTATLQTSLGIEPFAGSWRLQTVAEVDALPLQEPVEDLAALVPDADVTEEVEVDRGSLAPERAPQPALPEVTPALLGDVHALQPERESVAEEAAPTAWTRWAITAWLCGGTLFALLFLRAWLALVDRLARRRPLEDGPLPGLVALLRRKAGVRRPIRLAVSPRLQAPIAIGTVFPQIVVPPRALEELSHEMQESMLAHEVAHIARFDPLWFSFVRIIETVFFFQPLNRLAANRIRGCAELRCDGLAVEYTKNPIALARCLAEVAKWIVNERRPLPVCGMTGLSSPLGERVERILDTESERRGAGWPTTASTALLTLTTLVVPGFSSTVDADRAPNEPPASDESSPELPELLAPEPEPTASPTAPAPSAPLSKAMLVERTALEFEAALVALEDELAQIRRDAGERDVPARVLAELNAMDQRVRAAHARNQKIQELLSAIARREGEQTNERDRKEDR